MRIGSGGGRRRLNGRRISWRRYGKALGHRFDQMCRIRGHRWGHYWRHGKIKTLPESRRHDTRWGSTTTNGSNCAHSRSTQPSLVVLIVYPVCGCSSSVFSPWISSKTRRTMGRVNGLETVSNLRWWIGSEVAKTLSFPILASPSPSGGAKVYQKLVCNGMPNKTREQPFEKIFVDSSWSRKCWRWQGQ